MITALFNQAITTWVSVVDIQTKIAELTLNANSKSSFIDLREHTRLSTTVAALTLKKQHLISQAISETSQYTYEKYGISIGRKYRFNVAGWDPFDMVVDMLKPAGTLSAPMIVCMGYLDSGARKSVILYKSVEVEPLEEKVISIATLLRVKSGKLPISISAKND